MKRFKLEKLIVISDSEKKSKEISFSYGLNIVIGENKTGKSSLIKSIFYTLGCELKMESSWKRLISLFYLKFKYGEYLYELIRVGKRFILFEIKDEEVHLLIDTSSFHEFCDFLTLSIFEIDFPFITNELREINVTTPILWRFQYIDQDTGWGKIGESFTNMRYIKNWREHSNKFVIGYQAEEFYKTKKLINIFQDEVKKLKVKHENIEELISRINEKIKINESKNIIENVEPVNSLLNKIDFLEKESFRLKESLSKLKNLRYEKLMSLKMLENMISDLELDFDFAKNESDELICPFCGTTHQNTIVHRTEIVKDIQTGNELVKEHRIELTKLENDIQETSHELKKLHGELKINKTKLEKERDGISLINNYKTEGKKEFIKISNEEGNLIQKDIENKIIEIENYNETLSSYKSNKRVKEIKNEFNEHYIPILNLLNVPTTFLKLKDFVQVLDNTGSELPRLIYAYHIALYKYNLSKNRGIFSWLIVDTPNQQGQDNQNLKNIDKVLSEVLTKKGQFILGTERPTGYEDRAAKVIKLDGYKQTLDSNSYLEHKKYIEWLMQKTEISV